jgi:hypothetical protein
MDELLGGGPIRRISKPRHRWLARHVTLPFNIRPWITFQRYLSSAMFLCIGLANCVYLSTYMEGKY